MRNRFFHGMRAHCSNNGILIQIRQLLVTAKCTFPSLNWPSNFAAAQNNAHPASHRADLSPADFQRNSLVRHGRIIISSPMNGNGRKEIINGTFLSGVLISVINRRRLGDPWVLLK